MNKVVLIAVLMILVGCNDGVEDAIRDMNTTNVVENNFTAKIDNDFTADIDNNVTIVIAPRETGAYGEGTFNNPYLMMNANYKLSSGTQYFITPAIHNANCTIRVRTKVVVSGLNVEGSDLLPIDVRFLAQDTFEFDANESDYVSMELYVNDTGYLTMIGQGCLDEPRLFDMDYSE